MAPSTLSLRPATVADVEVVVALVESAYRGDPSREGWTTEADLLDGQRTDADEVRALVSSDAGVVLLAEEGDGQVVGCCHLRIEPGQAAHLGLFAVRPRLQGRGVGRALLRHAEDVAARAGAGSVQMTVLAQRPDLIAWYERLGYRLTGATLPFPHHDARFGLPKRADLVFEVLEREVG